MRSAIFYACLLGGVLCLTGCSGGRSSVIGRHTVRSSEPIGARQLFSDAISSPGFAEAPADPIRADGQVSQDGPADGNDSAEPDGYAAATGDRSAAPVKSTSGKRSNPSAEGPRPAGMVRPVSHESATATAGAEIQNPAAPKTIYGIRVVDRSAELKTVAVVPAADPVEVPAEPDVTRETIPLATVSVSVNVEAEPEPQPAAPADIESPDVILLNLPTALSLVGGRHPAVAFAQWRVQEAYARLDQADTLWLPSLRAGFSFHRHDGNYQASNGDIVDVNRSSLQYGLGAGATGAGTTPLPGLQARFHLADAIFEPDIARKTAWASGHARNAVVNRQLLDTALAYMNLLASEQRLGILHEARNRLSDLVKLTDDFAAAGRGLRADADRMQTELTLLDGRIAAAREHVHMASARLIHALSADAGRRIVPADPTVVPIELVTVTQDTPSLIQSGLENRPELKESQALVAAACDRYRREKYASLVPSVLLGFSSGQFGGGLGNTVNNVNDRYDFDAVVTWEVRNLGFGERAARRRTEAQFQQAMFRKVRMMDDVAREIAEAHTQVLHRSERMAITQTAIPVSEHSYHRNLARIREGQGLPLEVLQSSHAMEQSQQAYLNAVADYNEAQFQLQWALGWPVTAGQSYPSGDGPLPEHTPDLR